MTEFFDKIGALFKPKNEQVIKNVVEIPQNQVLKISYDGGKTWQFGKTSPPDARNAQSGFYIDITDKDKPVYGHVPINQEDLKNQRIKVVKASAEEAAGKRFADELVSPIT